MLKQMKLTTVRQASIYEHPKLRQIEIQLWFELHPPPSTQTFSSLATLQSDRFSSNTTLSSIWDIEVSRSLPASIWIFGLARKISVVVDYS